MGNHQAPERVTLSAILGLFHLHPIILVNSYGCEKLIYLSVIFSIKILEFELQMITKVN